MTKNKISVAKCIEQVLKKEKELEYYDLLDKVKDFFEKINDKEHPFKHVSEFNQRLKSFISNNKIVCDFKTNLDLTEFTNFKEKIPKDKIKCILYWVDQKNSSVHSEKTNQIIDVIKSNFGRNIIQDPIIKYEKDYNLSKIEFINNDVHTVKIEFYRFKTKDNAQELFKKESKLGYDVPYKEYSVEEINKVYKFNIDYSFKAYIIYSNKNVDWTNISSNENSKAVIFLVKGNFYIKYESKFKHLNPDIEPALKLTNKIVNTISKK